MIRLYLRSVVEAALTVACLPVALVVVLAAEKVGKAQEVEESAADYHTACCALIEAAADAREAEGFVEEDLEQWAAELIWGDAL